MKCYFYRMEFVISMPKLKRDKFEAEGGRSCRSCCKQKAEPNNMATKTVASNMVCRLVVAKTQITVPSYQKDMLQFI